MLNGWSTALNVMPLFTGNFLMRSGNNVKSGKTGALWPILAVTQEVQLSKKHLRHLPHSGKLLNIKDDVSLHNECFSSVSVK